MSHIVADGLWRRNPALVQLLGLCPLLAVTSSTVNAVGLGLATLLVMLGSNVCVSLVRHWIPAEVRLPAFMLIIASFTTTAMLVMQAFAFELYLAIAIFIQIIVTNCAILGRIEAFASREPVHRAVLDAFAMGLGFLWVLLLLGGVRELLAEGTLFANMHLLFGERAKGLTITLIPEYRGFLIAALPVGAFVVMGFVLAIVKFLGERGDKTSVEQVIVVRASGDLP
jgi:electron transport complex protein RnfE